MDVLNSSSWIDGPVESASVEMLYPSAIDYFRKKARSVGILGEDVLGLSDERLLDALGILRDGHPTRAAVLLFTSYDGSLVENVKVVVEHHRRAGCSDVDSLNGPLVYLPDLLFKSIYAQHIESSAVHHDRGVAYSPYPTEALRETISNAIVHNDYSSGEPISVRIWDNDRIIISNVWFLSADFNPESLDRPSPPNPSLYRIFTYLGYTVGDGNGVERLLKAYDFGNGLKPCMFFDDRHFTVTLDNLVKMV